MGLCWFYGVLWCFNGIYPLVNIQKTNGKSPPETMGKSTISKWAIFNSYVLNYQRVGFNTKLIWFWKGTHRKTGKPRFLCMEKRLHGVKVESQSHWKAVQVLDWIQFCNLRCHQRKPPRPTPCFSLGFCPHGWTTSTTWSTCNSPKNPLNNIENLDDEYAYLVPASQVVTPSMESMDK